MSKNKSPREPRRAGPAARAAVPAAAATAILALCGLIGCGQAPEDDAAAQEAPAQGAQDPLTIKIDVPGQGGGGGGGGGSTKSKAEISLDSQLIFFSQICPGAKAQKVLQLKNKGEDPLIVRKLEVGGKAFSITALPKLPKTLLTGERLELTIEFSPPANRPEQLDQQGTLNITSNDRKREVTSIPLRGLLPPPTLAFSSRQLSLGELEVGEGRTRTLTLRNIGQCAASIGSYDVSGTQDENVIVEGLRLGTLNPGGTNRLRVTGLCGKRGDLDVKLRIIGTGGMTLATGYVVASCD